MTELALVLGGGGAAGNAWEIGVLAGLAEAGADLTDADLVIGTSAGATAAAQVRSGVPISDLLAQTLTAVPGSGATRSDRSAGQRPPALPMEVVFARMRAIGAAATSSLELRRAMGAFGLESDAVLHAGARQRRDSVAARLPSTAWSTRRRTVIVAVDAHTGELAAFDQDSGVDLVDAVTASCALPGLAPTHPVGGVACIDGGVRSNENADLAAGYSQVVVLSPLGGHGRASQPGQFEGLRRPPEWGMELTSQVASLRAGGSRVEVLIPDDESRAAMGVNMMDPVSRAPTARAGRAQGLREAARLRG